MKQLGACDSCGELAMCTSIEVASCVRRRICDICQSIALANHVAETD